ncbi:cytochrome P450 family protein [Ceratobasidium sp. AG-Ba]|nr:cytochrome P450 family protein [Ceratobasidium sp. AG-Ba]
MSHSVLHKAASMQFWPTTVKQSMLAMQRLIHNPNKFRDELKLMTGKTLLSAVYAYEVTSLHDPLVEVVVTALKHISEAALPGKTKEMIDTPFKWAEDQIHKGNTSPSVVKTLLSELGNQKDNTLDIVEEIDRIKWATGTLFAGTSQRHIASILIFVLAMTLYPEVQSQARAEIDQAIGKDRLPEMEDRDLLPYIECVMKEVLGWQSVAPLAVPHVCTEGDEYAGYRIPKGAPVFGNVWY